MASINSPEVVPVWKQPVRQRDDDDDNKIEATTTRSIVNKKDRLEPA
jgi:hypothetical protein